MAQERVSELPKVEDVNTGVISNRAERIRT